jgi:hypothetical protein
MGLDHYKKNGGITLWIISLFLIYILILMFNDIIIYTYISLFSWDSVLDKCVKNTIWLVSNKEDKVAYILNQ